MERYYPYTHFIEDSITFVRCGDNLGWFYNKNGNRYGDFVTEKVTTKERVDEIWALLKKQAQQTIKLI